MLLITTLLFVPTKDKNATIWLFAIAISMILVIFILNKISGGFLFRYRKSKIYPFLRDLLVIIHIFGALLMALLLPNSVLIDYPYFMSIYEQNPLLIPLSMLVLFFGLFLIFGLLFGMIFNLLERKEARRNE
jgi:amino acid transporter